MDFNRIKSELKFSTARSGGSGGQHVNKVETKVTLKFKVADSAGLTDQEKILVLKRLSSYINKDGILVLSHDRSRSQLKNKTAVLIKLEKYLDKVLIKKKKRIPSRPSKASIKASKEHKKRKSALKQSRKKPPLDD